MPAPMMKAACVSEPSMEIPVVKAATKYTNEAATVEAVGIPVRIRIPIIIRIAVPVPVGRLRVPGGFSTPRVTPGRHTLQIFQLVGDGLGRFWGGCTGNIRGDSA